MKVLFFLLCLMSFSLSVNAQNVSEDRLRPFITSLSWNVQMLPNDWTPFAKFLRRKQSVRLPWIIEHCNQTYYDVIVFQEVIDRGLKRKLMKGLSELYPYQIEPKRKFGRWFNSGVMIVSRHPLQELGHITYDKGIHIDKMGAKGCVLVEMDVNGVKFQIAGTHLQSEDDHEAQQLRNKQYQQIHDLLETHRNSDIPLLLLGDFNTPKKNKDAYEHMIKTMEVMDSDIRDNRPYTYDSNNSWTPTTTPRQLDYIFHREGKDRLSPVQTILRLKKEHKGQLIDYSDHHGVISIIYM